MSDRNNKPTYRLVIRAMPSASDGVIRNLRRLLKSLARAFGFRCVSIEELKPDAEQGDEH